MSSHPAIATLIHIGIFSFRTKGGASESSRVESAMSNTMGKSKEERQRQRQEDARRASEWAKRRATQRAARSEAVDANANAAPPNNVHSATKRNRREERTEAKRRADEWAAKRKAARMTRDGKVSDCGIQETADRDDQNIRRTITEDEQREAEEELPLTPHRLAEYEAETKKEAGSSSRLSLFRIVVSGLVSAAICFGFSQVTSDNVVVSGQPDDIMNAIGVGVTPPETLDASLIAFRIEEDGDL